MTQYKTEDGVLLNTGDRAYDYYNMKPGKIAKENPYMADWFYFNHDDGTTEMLNGQRICSMAFARARRFKDADPPETSYEQARKQRMLAVVERIQNASAHEFEEVISESTRELRSLIEEL